MYKLLYLFIATLLYLNKPDVVHEEVYMETITIDAEEVNNSNRIIKIKTMERKCPYTDEEIELIALVTLAEAEGECEEGKRLVIDTILNRVDSSYFPNTVSEVIYQKNQFSSMWDGRCERVTVSNDICELVREEINSRYNADVIFFTANDYGNYGIPMFQVGNHYFSSYD